MNFLEVLFGIIPETVLLFFALLFLMVGVFTHNQRSNISMIYCSILVNLLIIVFLLLKGEMTYGTYFYNNILINQQRVYFKIVILLLYSLVLLLCSGSLKIDHLHGKFEHLFLMQMAVIAGCLLVSSCNLLMMFLALEMQSLAVYVLTAFDRNNIKSSEAGIKYFVFGAIFSSIMLFGISLIYGSTSSIDYRAITSSAIIKPDLYLVSLIGVSMVFLAIAAKLALAPFHMWAIDVYEGAPMVAVAFFSSCQKVSILFLLINLLQTLGDSYHFQISGILKFLAGISVLIGSIGALSQIYLKRLIAYSTILNFGFSLIALSSYRAQGIWFTCAYIIIYAITVLGFLSMVIAVFGKLSNDLQITQLNGLSNTRKSLAFTISLILFSLIGIPPLGGFFAKYIVFYSALIAKSYFLICIGLIASLIAAYYYLNIIKAIYLSKSFSSIVRLKIPYDLVLVNALSIATILIGALLLISNNSNLNYF